MSAPLFAYAVHNPDAWRILALGVILGFLVGLAVGVWLGKRLGDKRDFDDSGNAS